MLKGYPKMIGRSCFVDPVTFCSWEGGESSHPFSPSKEPDFEQTFATTLFTALVERYAIAY
jgi:hypothetical protein